MPTQWVGQKLLPRHIPLPKKVLGLIFLLHWQRCLGTSNAMTPSIPWFQVKENIPYTSEGTCTCFYVCNWNSGVLKAALFHVQVCLGHGLLLGIVYIYSGHYPTHSYFFPFDVSLEAWCCPEVFWITLIQMLFCSAFSSILMRSVYSLSKTEEAQHYIRTKSKAQRHFFNAKINKSYNI